MDWNGATPVSIYPGIGQMIEFLGNDLDNITLFKKSGNYSVGLQFCDCWEVESLCNNLWEACKYKLK